MKSDVSYPCHSAGKTLWIHIRIKVKRIKANKNQTIFLSTLENNDWTKIRGNKNNVIQGQRQDMENWHTQQRT